MCQLGKAVGRALGTVRPFNESFRYRMSHEMSTERIYHPTYL